MARSLDDLIEVNLYLLAKVSLDLERIEQDPVFQSYLLTAASRDAALEGYIGFYVAREQFLKNMPSTNGPGELYYTGAPDIPSIGEKDATDPSGSTQCA